MQRTTDKQKIITENGKPTLINADRYRTGQVLTNLLSNAIKYSPDSKKIVVKTRVEKENLIVSVQDFGIGIEQDMLNKVFDRFFRVSHSTLNTFPGLGLGLYIAAEFIKRQGGKIWATSNPGKGSTFSFSLPLNGSNDKN
jgi:signal transduction histidine kinase